MMSKSHEVEPQYASWEATGSAFSVGRPTSLGCRNAAVLRRSAENTLTLETKYNPPDDPLLLFIDAAVFVVFVAVGLLAGISLFTIIIASIAVDFAIYLLARFWRQRNLILDLATSATEAIVDEKRRRIAFLATIDAKSRWITLQFESDFSGRLMLSVISSVRNAGQRKSLSLT